LGRYTKKIILILHDSFFFNNVISFIQMPVTLNTPKIHTPFGVSLFHPLLIIEGCNQNCRKGMQTIYYIHFLYIKYLFA